MTQLIEWLIKSKAPAYIVTAFEILSLQARSADRLASLSAKEQQRFLGWCDIRQLTLLLPYLCESQLSASLREAVATKRARYDLRFRRIKQELFAITGALNDANVEFVMLKGLSHSPAFTPDPACRAQGDIDFWIPKSSVFEARDVLKRLGYVPMLSAQSRHLGPMAKPSNWRWSGDLFDPEMPISVELHYQLWADRDEYIRVPGLDQFWERKELRHFDGHSIHVLCKEDLLGFAALHLMLHLLHGELPLQRAWEIAHFLNTYANEDSFWKSWRDMHPSALKGLETCIFVLLTKWFDCNVGSEFKKDLKTLPLAARAWLDRYSFAPIRREWKPNKAELWLHLALIDSRKNKAKVLLRRLFPAALPLFVDSGAGQARGTTKLSRFRRQIPFVFRRLMRHAVTFFPTLFDGVRLRF